MASISHSVSGKSEGEWVRRKFRDTDEGRRAAKEFAACLKEARTSYDVRTRIAGRMVTRTFRRRKEADTYAAKVEGDKLRGEAIDPRGSRTPFAEVANAWIAANPSKRASSEDRDRAIIKHHLDPAFGQWSVGSITRADIQGIVNRWATVKAPSTVLRQYATLRAILAHAEAAELIFRSPCREIRLPEAEPADRPQLTPEQLDTLAKALGPDQAVMAWCGAVLGLRWAEAAGLTVDRLDLLGGKLRVDRQLTRDRVLAAPKSRAGRRTLACPVWLIDELAGAIARRGLTAADGDSFVFVTPRGSPLDYSRWLSRVWKPACRRAGLPTLKYHDLRSLAASALVAAGVDVKTAQKRLGHSSARVTLDIYARATAEADRQAADLVGARFRPRDTRATGTRPPETVVPAKGA